jgi:hypothetical protein
MRDMDAQDLFEWVTVPLNSLLELCAAPGNGTGNLADDGNKHRMLKYLAHHIDEHRNPASPHSEHEQAAAGHARPAAPSLVNKAVHAAASVPPGNREWSEDLCLPQRAYGAPHVSGSNAFAARSLATPDLHRAQLGNLVLAVTSGYAAYSTDGGNNFRPLDPGRIFPQGPGGTCCREQTAVFLPQIDRFAWIMRLSDATGSRHFVRVAAASPQEIVCTKCTGWTYWDLALSLGGAGRDMFSVEAAEQTDRLWVGLSTRHGNRQEIHLPLAQIGAGAPICMPISRRSRPARIQLAGSQRAIAHSVAEQS